MKDCLAMLAAGLRHAAACFGVRAYDAPLFRARCKELGQRSLCRAVAPRFAFDVRLDPRKRSIAHFVIIPVEVLANGVALELDAFAMCETRTSLLLAVRRARFLAGCADVTRFDETAFLAA